MRTIYAVFGHGLETRARRHAELIAALPEGTDDRQLKELLAAENQRIAEQGHARLNRRVDWSAVAAFVVVLAVTTGVSLGLWQLPQADVIPGWAAWISRPAAVAVALFGGLLMLAGSLSMFTQTDQKDD